MAQRKRQDRSSLRLAEWPGVDDRVLNERSRTSFRARQTAVQAYASGTTLDAIEAATGVRRASLLRLVARAQAAHPDGRLWGFRALVPDVRVRPYQRMCRRVNILLAARSHVLAA